MGDSKHIVSSRHSRADANTYKLTAAHKTCTGSRQTSSSTKRGKWTLKLCAVDTNWQREKKNPFSSTECHWVYQPNSRAGPTTPRLFLWTVLLCLVMFCLTGLLFVHEVWWVFLFFERENRLGWVGRWGGSRSNHRGEI